MYSMEYESQLLESSFTYLFVWAKWSVGVPTAVDFLRPEK